MATTLKVVGLLLTLGGLICAVRDNLGLAAVLIVAGFAIGLHASFGLAT